MKIRHKLALILVGLLVTALVQGLRLLDRVVLGYLGGMTAAVLGLVVYFARLPREAMGRTRLVPIDHQHQRLLIGLPIPYCLQSLLPCGVNSSGNP